MKNIFEGHNFIGLISITKKRHISVQGHSFDKTVSCFPTDTWQKMCVSTFVHIANHTLQLHRKYDQDFRLQEHKLVFINSKENLNTKKYLTLKMSISIHRKAALHV